MININEYHKKLVNGVNQVMESESFKEFMEFSAKFRNYSFNNTLLIWVQRRGVTHVAGLKAWNSLDRRVKKGEKGIVIFAPLFRKEKKKGINTSTKDDIEPESKKLVGFRAVRVWDVEQTVGKPLPELRTETPIMDGDPEELYLKILLASPISVGYEEIKGRANGYYMPKEQKIIIAKNLKTEQRSKTLLHELAHHLIINGTSEKKSEKPDRHTGEVIAEGAAFIASAHFGLDSSGYSFPYIASWSKEPDKVLKAGETIRTIGIRLIEIVEAVQL